MRTTGLSYSAFMPSVQPRAGLSQSDLVFALLQGAGVAAFILQCVIDANVNNVVPAAIILGSSTITFQYLRLTKAFFDCPVSSFAILGLCVTTQWGALVAQSCAWTAVASDLRNARETFSILGAFQIVSLTSQWTIRNLRPLVRTRLFVSDRILRPVGLFQVPSPGNLWLMGSVGLLALLIAGTPVPDIDFAQLSLTTKIAHGFSFLAWAPFLVPVLYQRHGSEYCNIRRQMVGLSLYLFAAVAAGVLLNIRSVMLAGVTTVGLLYLMLGLTDSRPARYRALRRLLPLALGGALLVGYAADLSTAMAIARGQRGNVSSVDMVKETLAVFVDRVAIELYRDGERLFRRTGVYDEYYIDNPVVARFVETKFHDNMFFLIRDLNNEDVAALRNDLKNRVIGIFPDPVIRLFGFDVDKSVYNYSMGDFFDFLRYGSELGGFKTGSIFANILAMFGNSAYGLYFAVCAVACLIWDSLSRQFSAPTLIISPVIMLLGWPLFLNGIVAESLGNLTLMMFRSLPQSIIIYTLVFFLAKLVFQPYRSSNLAAPMRVGAEILGTR